MTKRILPVILLLLVGAGVAYSEPMEIPAGSKCHLCGMEVDPESEYSAQIVEGGVMLPFCDVGDLLYHYNKQDGKPSELYVRDMQSKGWVDALKATYIKSGEFSSPMGWGIAAFSDREEAAKYGSPMDFGEALNAVR